MLLDEKLPMFLYHERGNILIKKGPGPMNIRIASSISGTIHTYPDPHIDRDPPSSLSFDQSQPKTAGSGIQTQHGKLPDGGYIQFLFPHDFS